MSLKSTTYTAASQEAGASIGDMLDKNAMTTAGVLIGAGTAVAGAGILTVALPAQVFGATALSAGLIYAGDRKDKGLKIFANPFNQGDDATVVSTAAV